MSIFEKYPRPWRLEHNGHPATSSHCHILDALNREVLLDGDDVDGWDDRTAIMEVVVRAVNGDSSK